MEHTSALTDARKAMGYKTTAAFARAVGVERNTAWNWEHGVYTPAMPVAIRVAHLLGHSVEEIWGQPDRAPEYPVVL